VLRAAHELADPPCKEHVPQYIGIGVAILAGFDEFGEQARGYFQSNYGIFPDISAFSILID
jgi:hypothetical protein